MLLQVVKLSQDEATSKFTTLKKQYKCNCNLIGQSQWNLLFIVYTITSCYITGHVSRISFCKLIQYHLHVLKTLVITIIIATCSNCVKKSF